MRFDMFENLCLEDAEAILHTFLSSEPANLEIALKRWADPGFDFSLESIPGFIRFIMPKLETRPIPVDESVPEWIRSTEDYKNSLYEFDEPSSDLIVSAAYYIGEAFRLNCEDLKWGTGDQETAFANMPVVQGFEDGRELPPIVVLKNLIRRIIEEPEKDGDIEKMVDRWRSMASC